MRIGFDAKRAFHNSTGLGNYGRTLINSLANNYPANEYFLYNPKKIQQTIFFQKNIIEILPTHWFDKLFPSLWRQKNIVKGFEQQIDLFHGLSNELPFGMEQLKIKSVVTIHDLIFEHYPEQYYKSDVLIYRKKFKHACSIADKIIAISEATKNDLVNLYHIASSKIDVCYQSCDERYFTCLDEGYLNQVKEKYSLSLPYFISVGSIIERKNLLSICKSFKKLNKTNGLKLLIVGKGHGIYKQKVLDFIQEAGLSQQVFFMEDHFSTSDISKDLPALYKLSKGLIYPSLMEGFGIPVLEAMAIGTAVITSSISSLPEVGGHAAQTIDPSNIEELAEAMQKLLQDNNFRNQCIEGGHKQAALFSNENVAANLMNIYKSILK